jgi:hypothetical protein
MPVLKNADVYIKPGDDGGGGGCGWGLLLVLALLFGLVGASLEMLGISQTDSLRLSAARSARRDLDRGQEGESRDQ